MLPADIYISMVDWVQLGYVDLSSYAGDGVKQVKLGGKITGKGSP